MHYVASALSTEYTYFGDDGDVLSRSGSESFGCGWLNVIEVKMSVQQICLEKIWRINPVVQPTTKV